MMSALFNLSLIPSPWETFSQSMAPPAIASAAAQPVVDTSAGALSCESRESAPADFSIQSSDGGVVAFDAERQVSDGLQLVGREKAERSEDSGNHVHAHQVGAMQIGTQSPKDTSAGVATGPSETFHPPLGFVLIAQADIDRMMSLIADLVCQLQAEREADRIDHADYNRLLELERQEMLLPPFLGRPAPVFPMIRTR